MGEEIKGRVQKQRRSIGMTATKNVQMWQRKKKDFIVSILSVSIFKHLKKNLELLVAVVSVMTV